MGRTGLVVVMMMVASPRGMCGLGRTGGAEEAAEEAAEAATKTDKSSREKSQTSSYKTPMYSFVYLRSSTS